MLIFGLGNPEKKYQKTRHNVGFLVLDELHEKTSPLGKIQWASNKSLKSRLFKQDNLILAQPQVNMNVNGEAVQAIADFYKIPPEEIVVVHDDLDLPLGEIKVVRDRGTAGHRGVRSVVRRLGTNGFWRVRIGIGHPLDDQAENCSEDDKSRQVTEYVLSEFKPDEKEQLHQVISKAVKIIKQGVKGGFDRLEGKHGIRLMIND